MNLAKSKRTKKIMSEIKKEDVVNAIARMRESDLMQAGKQRGRLGFR